MKWILHKAATRGHVQQGWMQSYHSFSFGGYYNPERMNFGVLRVLNDDTVAAGMGFGTHPHRDMEIISIPLVGNLEHKDSMGNTAVIRSGDIQVLSAGTGISHSEYNKSNEIPVKFLQIWVLPNKMGVTPRYDQLSLKVSDRYNQFQQILSPNPKDEGVWIYQNAWFHQSHLESGKELTYTLKRKKENGVYVFIIEGSVELNGQKLTKRDGLGVWDIEYLNIKGILKSELLLMEIPMK